MGNSRVRFPHTISYRLTNEDYLKLQREIHNTGLTPHDWCRLVVLDRLNRDCGFSKTEEMFFEQMCRTQYLVANGFQLLADENLTPEEWKKFRKTGKEKIDVITGRALADFRARREAPTVSPAGSKGQVCPQ